MLDDPVINSPKPFQFRIRDIVLVTTLVGGFLAGLVQFNPWLILASALATILCVAFVWRWQFGTIGKTLAGLTIFVMFTTSCLPWIGTPAYVARQSACSNYLKQIAVALHNYHDIYDSFPPAYIADENGRPMHSWRVLILPFMEQQPTYDKYRFDEPWDGPNNSLLADRIKNFYACPNDNDPKNSVETSYVAIIGLNTAWQGEKALTFADFADGTSNVLMVVEVHNSGIHWMEPRDLHVTQMTRTINAKHGQGISSEHPKGAQAVFTDGAVKFLPADTPPDVLQSWINRNDGTLVDPWQ